MASINKTRSGHWQARIRRKGHPTLTKTFLRKINAAQWVREIENQIDQSLFKSTSRAEKWTLATLLDRFEKEVIAKRKSPSTDPSRIKNIKVCNIEITHDFGKKYWVNMGNTPLIDLKPEMIDAFLERRLEVAIPEDADDHEILEIQQQNKKERRVGAASVRREMNIISRVINHAMAAWGLFLPHGNPCANIPRPSKPKPRVRRVTGEELLQIYLHTESEVMPYICIFGVETAMRRGEIAQMKWEHFDFQNRLLHIPETKTDEPRTIPLSKTAIQTLGLMPRTHTGKVWDMTADAITRAFIRARDRAEIENLHFHDLRHEAASRLSDMRMDITEIQAITGHSDLNSLKIYIHKRPKDLVRVLDRVQEQHVA